MNNHLFSTYQLGGIHLQNRVVMAPMTRSRATGNTPNALMAQYYAQRANAGLIITEGMSPSRNGLGYTNMPGIFTEEQINGWKLVTQAVHKGGGRIFAQLMHAGRIAHIDNLPVGAKVLGPSATRAAGQIYTFQGMQNMSAPRAMTSSEITDAQKEFVEAAKNAVAAGFDGVELHGANGYLFEQFLSPHVNSRTDDYGGTITNRARFLLETAGAVSAAIGADRVGVRLSPFSTVSDMHAYDEATDTYLYLAEKLNETGIAYLHVVENEVDLIPTAFKKALGKRFSQTIILAGNYDKLRAEQDIKSGLANVIAFGRPFLNNPDFVTRLRNNWPLSDNLDVSTLFTPDEKGYTDYQPYQSSMIAV